MANEVGAGNMTPDTAWRIEPDTLLPERLRREDDLARHYTVLDDFLLVVKIIDEQVQRPDALFQTALDAVPFRGRHDAGNEIEGQRFLHTGAFPVNVKRDPHLDQRLVGGLLTDYQFTVGQRLDVSRQRPGRSARLSIFSDHLIEEIAGLVAAKFHRAGCESDRWP